MQPIIQSKNADGTLNILMPVTTRFVDATGAPLQAYIEVKMTPEQIDAKITQATDDINNLQALKTALPIKTIQVQPVQQTP